MSISNQSFRLPRALEILLVLVVVLELIAPFTTNTYGVDGRLQVNMIGQFTRLVSEGILIPRWVPDGFHGFGAATFYFYPPVMLYMASAFHILTGLTNPYTLYQMAGLAATIASFFTARVLIKSIGKSKYQINIGALLYAFAPFRLADLYGRSNLATHVAYVFIPLVWWGLSEILRDKESLNPKRIIQLGVSCALLALTNVPAVLATSVCIVVAAIVIWKQLTWRSLISASLAALIAVGLCAFHFSSAISLGPYAYLSSLDGGDPPFILLHLFEKSSIPALYYILLLYAAIAIIILGYWNARKSGENVWNTEQTTISIGLAIVVLTIFLETPYLSLPVWRYIPVFKLIQFGWRFYTYFVLLTAVIVGIAYSFSMRRASRNIVWLWVLGALGPAILIVFSLHIFEHASRPLEDAIEYRTVYSEPNDDFIRRLPKDRAIFFAVTDEMTKIYAPHESDSPAVADLQNNEKISRIDVNANSEEFDVNLQAQKPVTFHRFFWPDWHLYANGKEIISRPDSIGRAVALLPAGNYIIRWQLEKTPLEIAGMWISGITWGLLLAVSGISLVRQSVRKHRLAT